MSSVRSRSGPPGPHARTARSACMSCVRADVWLGPQILWLGPKPCGWTPKRCGWAPGPHSWRWGPWHHMHAMPDWHARERAGHRAGKQGFGPCRACGRNLGQSPRKTACTWRQIDAHVMFAAGQHSRRRTWSSSRGRTVAASRMLWSMTKQRPAAHRGVGVIDWNTKWP